MPYQEHHRLIGLNLCKHIGNIIEAYICVGRLSIQLEYAAHKDCGHHKHYLFHHQVCFMFRLCKLTNICAIREDLITFAHNQQFS